MNCIGRICTRKYNADSVNSIKWMHINAIHFFVFYNAFVTIVGKYNAKNSDKYKMLKVIRNK